MIENSINYDTLKALTRAFVFIFPFRDELFNPINCRLLLLFFLVNLHLSPLLVDLHLFSFNFFEWLDLFEGQPAFFIQICLILNQINQLVFILLAHFVDKLHLASHVRFLYHGLKFGLA